MPSKRDFRRITLPSGTEVTLDGDDHLYTFTDWTPEIYEYFLHKERITHNQTIGDITFELRQSYQTNNESPKTFVLPETFWTKLNKRRRAGGTIITMNRIPFLMRLYSPKAEPTPSSRLNFNQHSTITPEEALIRACRIAGLPKPKIPPQHYASA